MNEQHPRPLSGWIWILAALFFPSGLFVAFGGARLLSWRRSVILAFLSYASVIGFVESMVILERGNAGYLPRYTALSIGMLVSLAWGFALYRIGRTADYWTPLARRVWRIAGYIALLGLALSLANVGLWVAALVLRP